MKNEFLLYAPFSGDYIVGIPSAKRRSLKRELQTAPQKRRKIEAANARREKRDNKREYNQGKSEAFYHPILNRIETLKFLQRFNGNSVYGKFGTSPQ